MDEADSDFICHSRTDIPMLIKQHEQDKKQINILTKALEMAVNLMCDNKVPATVESFIQQAQKICDENGGCNNG